MKRKMNEKKKMIAARLLTWLFLIEAGMVLMLVIFSSLWFIILYFVTLLAAKYFHAMELNSYKRLLLNE